jgi:hypothetical protein
VASLYDDGWRQGSRLTACLPNDTVVLNTANEPSRDQKDCDRWVVATQDCDLAYTDPGNAAPTIELHPVLRHEPDPNTDWGIRSRRFVLSEGEHVVSPSPHTLVSAAVLTAVRSSAGLRVEPLPDLRAAAFKRWLGYRYDRPAVPEQFVALAQRVAKEVQRNRRRFMGRQVRDVLMQFDDAQHRPRFSLYAVIRDPADEQVVRGWLADIALAIPVDLGIGDEFVAVTSQQVTLHLIETSYAADVTQLTWRGSTPEGAF